MVEKKLRPAYLDTFVPHWLFVDGLHVGYMYCAETEEYTCVHDVNIFPSHRGKGYGIDMVFKSIADKQKPVVLRTSRSLENFYGKIGFEFACTNKIMNI